MVSGVRLDVGSYLHTICCFDQLNKDHSTIQDKLKSPTGVHKVTLKDKSINLTCNNNYNRLS